MAVKTRLEMPLLMTLGMGFAGFFTIVAGIAFPVALLFGGQFDINGEAVSRGEFLRSAGLLVVVVIGLMAGITYGYRTEKLWARHLAPAFWWASFLYGVLLAWLRPDEAGDWYGMAFQSGVFGVIAIWYFYGKRSVVAYYDALAKRQLPPTRADVSATAGA